MARIDIAVSYAEKEQVKALGARWDAARKTWFVPDGLSLEPFAAWLPQPPSYNTRAASYMIVGAHEWCWKCGAETRVWAVGLPDAHESANVVSSPSDLGGEGEGWSRAGYTGVATFIEHVSPAAAHRLSIAAPLFHPDYSRAAEARYWMNHCEHCGAKIGDFNLHSEPDGAFFPTTPEGMQRVEVALVSEAILLACGGIGLDPPYLRVR